ncbi:neuromodulin [Carcharodon carcharias]|uniref:neuromodulin n=1 Tax=Carcharodon carcharias TaxID=13397 RepID=UPI001B7F4E09|nr:neuromodulin [Carcharodon carcharias]
MTGTGPVLTVRSALLCQVKFQLCNVYQTTMLTPLSNWVDLSWNGFRLVPVRFTEHGCGHPMAATLTAEKNDEANAKAEQETTKPEDKAHKAATKIQASFRGHITRKKLKGEKKGESAAATKVEGGEKKDDAKKTEAIKEEEATATEPAAPGSEGKTEEVEKPVSNPEATPSDAEKASEAKEAPTENLEKATPAVKDEKATDGEKDVKETGSAASTATESTPSSNVTSSQEKEKKPVEAPAAEASEAATKAQTETAASSTAPEKTGQITRMKLPLQIKFSVIKKYMPSNS